MKRKKNWLLKLLTLMLIVTMGIADPAGISMVTAKAASPALSAKTLSIVVGQSCNLKLKNCTKKVTFTRSNTNVTISRVNSTTVKITGRKKGSAKITAKVGSKKYTCKVTVSNPKINMNIFKKKSIREWFERMSYGNDTGYLSFRSTPQLKKALPFYIRREYEYHRSYPQDNSMNTLVPRNVIHNYVYNTFGVRVSSVNLPVRNGNYVIERLWWQINTDLCFYKALPTTKGATIIVKEYSYTINGSRGSLYATHYFTVKKANNSRGFVITSAKSERA